LGGLLDGLATWAADVIDALGYIGVFALIVLENVFPPIPSEAILPLAGFLAGQGEMWLPAVIIAATLGAVAGALILYGLGAWFGDRRVRWLINRYGKWLVITEEDFDKANGWFNRYGGLAVLICRLVPIVRSLVSIPAGLRRMNLTTFIIYTAIGSGIWNSILVIAGWWLGDNWEEVGGVVDYLEYPVILGILGFGAWFLWKRRIAKLMPAIRSRSSR
jgi:membrane protein DedA with SNARE-associated domain